MGGKMIDKDRKDANRVLCFYRPDSAFPFGSADCSLSLRSAKMVYSQIYKRGVEAKVKFLNFLSDLRGCFFADDAKKIAWVKRQYLKVYDEALRISTAVSLMMLNVKTSLLRNGAL